MKKLTKRALMVLAATTLLGVPTIAMAEEPATTEVEIWVYFEDNETNYLRNVLDEWGKENGYSFNIVQYPFGDLNKQYTLGMVSGELPDLTMINNCDNASYIEMGMLEDITEYVEAWGEADQFYETSLNTTTVDGRIYGLPYNSNCLALFYDKDQLAEAGVEVPTTWDELKAAAKATTKDNCYGLSMSLINTDEGSFQYFPFLYSSGANMYEMGSEGAMAAMQLLKDMVDEGSMSAESINWTQADACQQFMQGNAAMMINGPWQLPVLRSEVPDKNWGVALIPVDKENASALGGEGFSIVKGADVEKVWPVMEFLMSKDTLADWNHSSGKLPPRKDSQEKYPEWTEDAELQVFFEAMNYAATLGPDSSWPEISVAMYTAIQESISGQASVEDACAKAQATIDGLVG